jgi:hypothetical protein
MENASIKPLSSNIRDFGPRRMHYDNWVTSHLEMENN